jgi:hypothetical protein
MGEFNFHSNPVLGMIKMGYYKLDFLNSRVLMDKTIIARADNPVRGVFFGSRGAIPRAQPIQTM